MAGRYGLGRAVVTGALRRLAAQGRVSEGEFLPGGRGAEWCDAEVLRLLRRRCLARLRKEAEPVPPEALGAFLPAWQDGGPASARGAASGGGPEPAGRRGRTRCTTRSSSWPGRRCSTSALETLALPGRVPGYQGALLDELTAAGEIVWAGAGGLPGGDGWLVLHARAHRPAAAAPRRRRSP